MTGLKRGTVALVPHQRDWEENATQVISILKKLLGSTALDIQHIGSTAIRSIHAKPIIDIAIGVKALGDVLPYTEALERHGFIYRGEDMPGQLLFVMGDMEKDTRTHHIHVVQWQGVQWNNYINFRDYLNAFTERAKAYDDMKQVLAHQFSNDRKSYTAGKQQLIDLLLLEARAWREKQ